ncbi:MAG: hypothetical protein L0H93_10445 [Nocardioides sp.]|nr:hypothetical protein [Nocardioides sp.]
MTENPELHPGLADPETEQGVIGGLMRHPTLVPKAAALIESEADFTNLRLGVAYRAIITAYQQGDDPTPARVRDLMRRGGDVADDLSTWLSELRLGSPLLPADVETLTDRVRSLARKRRVEHELIRTLNQVRDVAVDDEGALTAVQGAMTSMMMDAPGGSDLLSIRDAWLEAINSIEETGRQEGLPGLSVGSNDLDETLGGLQPGQLVVIGGRPSVGKSVVATDLFRAALRQDLGAMLFTLEMTSGQVSKRLISAEARVLYSSVRNGELTEEDWEKISNASSDFPHRNGVIVERSGLTVTQIAGLATQQFRMWETAGITPGLIEIDYLQIMGIDQSSRRSSGSRQQEIGEITRGLKDLGKRLGVPIVLLSQLGRGSERNPDKKPTMSDLRESGDIENDADIVILLHRPDMYDPDDPEAHPGSIFYIFAKFREGVTRTVERAHQYKYARIVDIAKRWDAV